MYGLVGRIRAVAGQRDALAAILMPGEAGMPGCLSYIVAEDASDPDGIWITEVWDNETSHKASLQLPSVQAAITKARPIIAGFDMSVKTTPISGV